MNENIKDKICPLCHLNSSLEDSFIPQINTFLNIEPVNNLFQTYLIHWDCYLNWTHQKEFAKLQFEHLKEEHETSDFYGKVYVDDDIAVFITITEPFEIKLFLMSTGSSISFSISDWLKMKEEIVLVSFRFHEIELDILLQNFLTYLELFLILKLLSRKQTGLELSGSYIVIECKFQIMHFCRFFIKLEVKKKASRVHLKLGT